MRRSIHRAVLVLILVASSVWACSNNTTTPTSPTTTLPTITATWTGTLNQNGGTTYPFTAQVGPIAATLTSIAPDETVRIGMSLGSWNGSACAVAIASDNLAQGGAVNGSVSAAGNYCVRVYDVGNIVDPVSFTVILAHY